MASRMAARALQIDRIDAGPAAIALTPRRFAADPSSARLVEKNGRLVLPGASPDDERAAQSLLEALAG